MSERNVRKTKIGKVISDKMDKTVVVAVEELEQHKLYKKPVKRTVKFHAHDEKNDACWRQGFHHGNAPAVQDEALESR